MCKDGIRFSSFSFSIFTLALRTLQGVEHLLIVICFSSFVINPKCVTSLFDPGGELHNESASARLIGSIDQEECKAFEQVIHLLRNAGKVDEFYLMLPYETHQGCAEELRSELLEDGHNLNPISFIVCNTRWDLNSLLPTTNDDVIKSRKIFVVVMCDLKEIVEPLWRKNHDMLFYFKWVLYNHSISGNNAEHYLNDAKSLIDFQFNSYTVMMTQRNGSKSNLDAYRVYRPTHLSQEVIMEPIPSKDWWYTRGERQRSDFRLNPLRITGVMDPQYASDTDMTYSKTPDGTLVPVFQDGFAVQILRALQQTINFTVIPKVTNAWGHIDDTDHEWKGMISLLLKGEADIGISSTADLPFRREAIDFNMPTGSLRLCAYFKKSKNFMNALALLQPFTSTLWISIVLWLLLLGTVLALFRYVLLRLHRIQIPVTQMAKNKTKRITLTVNYKVFSLFYPSPKIPMNNGWTGTRTNNNDGNCVLISELTTSAADLQQSYKGNRNTDDASKNKVGENSNFLWDSMDCFQWGIGIIALQGFYEIPKYDCVRVVIALGCLCSVIIYGAYAGTLISFLSVAVESIKSIEQLLSTSYVFSVVNSPISNKILMESTFGSNRAIYTRKRETPVYNGMNEAKKELLKGSFVYLVDNYAAYDSLQNNFSVSEACLINELTIPHVFQQLGSMTPKNSTYRRTFDYQILRMQEYGLVKVWSGRYVRSRTICNSQDVTGFQGVELYSVFVAFGAIGFGTFISVLFLIFEKRTSNCAFTG